MTTTLPAPEEPLEIAFQNLRENPADMSRWLAVEVLLAEPDALEDDDLVDRLCALQDRMEQATRAMYGLAVPGDSHVKSGKPTDRELLGSVAANLQMATNHLRSTVISLVHLTVHEDEDYDTEDEGAEDSA